MNKDQFIEMLKDLHSDELAWVHYNLTLPSDDYKEILRTEVYWRMRVNNVMVAMEFNKYIANFTYIKEITVDRLVEIIKELQEKVKEEFLSIDWSKEDLDIELDATLLSTMDCTMFRLVRYMSEKLMEKGAELIAGSK